MDKPKETPGVGAQSKFSVPSSNDGDNFLSRMEKKQSLEPVAQTTESSQPIWMNQQQQRKATNPPPPAP